MMQRKQQRHIALVLGSPSALIWEEVSLWSLAEGPNGHVAFFETCPLAARGWGQPCITPISRPPWLPASSFLKDRCLVAEYISVSVLGLLFKMPGGTGVPWCILPCSRCEGRMQLTRYRPGPAGPRGRRRAWVMGLGRLLQDTALRQKGVGPGANLPCGAHLPGDQPRRPNPLCKEVKLHSCGPGQSGTMPPGPTHQGVWVWDPCNDPRAAPPWNSMRRTGSAVARGPDRACHNHQKESVGTRKKG